MSNNRMFIRCKSCGSILCIGKIYLDGYYIPDSENFINKLNNFYDEHAFCYNDFNIDDILYAEPTFDKQNAKNINYENRFEICYETEIKND